ncbi:GntR family transcriptional regulator [Paenibacillus elgii]|uniref:GntR family transcriptional regulator n=1 Tax=Paenibacillus elgii TaxID=189691 RepID=UPI000FD9C46C|nr:GntR family transcriptional regulator [Paenibacillus elgii]NEN85841.1 GntR family transcriptional regulator [Paenibacillus elgii]
MIIRIEADSEVPIYAQLVNNIIEGIVNGRLRPEEPLPSVRRLASDIGIHMHTVNKAYKILEQGGFIQIHRRKGVVVQATRKYEDTERYIDYLKGALRPILTGAIYRDISLEQIHSTILEVYYDIVNSGGGE